MLSLSRFDFRRPRALHWLIPALFALCCSNSVFAAEGAQRVDDYLKGLNSLKADFEQFTFNAERTQMMERRGTLYLQRPGRFRWEYEGPDKQIIIADSQRVYMHDVELKQVSHQSQTKALRGTPALLLSNTDPIEQHFEVRPIESTDGRDWVELIPKDAETDVVRIELGFGRDTLDSLIMEDSFGQETRLNFTGAQRNVSLKPDLFKIDQRAVDDFLPFD
ncbi:LolA family protein [Allochromatium vinosum]|uniref:Outer-membrane lipoprotein carrier protein n=1 Tax=Allochromatium vinosum (strain ATCC 17899 / DSM 180 / NBRC 103801 / NCIMB 10441 / D) TaxID=572477 RepID=D3RT64_ALLVD|nr:outer membrane lipoprotein carrier protein LolA [Allochromatium vinosum]ADC62373.1 outer membrane lipoprotein carrier protein LolA [Allochromatium vinosum DSM 180]MBK1653225.1 outer membrane lipoprotein carrier protein LolA [Allochromatium vinosum]